jgi:hypothetical protein
MKNMKKAILLLATILIAGVSLNAQDLYLSWDGETLGENVTVWGEPTASEMEFHAIVHNNSGNGMNIKVRRTQIEIVDGTLNQFYWKVLYAPSIDESSNYLFVPDGGSSETTDFYGRYIPSSKHGTSTVEYTFYNKDNEDQNVKVTVKYWASPEGIAEDAMKGGHISDIYPNPATNTVNLDYNLPAGLDAVEVSIVNLLGAVVKKAVATRDENKLTMNISELEAGIYFYSVLVNDEVYKTKKLIIRK